jgi:hypothetical protein
MASPHRRNRFSGLLTCYWFLLCWASGLTSQLVNSSSDNAILTSSLSSNKGIQMFFFVFIIFKLSTFPFKLTFFIYSNEILNVN